MPPRPLTIGRLARSAGVGIETVRYYQRRELLGVPDGGAGYRHYPASDVQRIRFIKRAQELGFSLDEIADLLKLEDGGNRAQIRGIASDRRAQIQQKMADLQRVQRVLIHLIEACEHTSDDLPCPIIESLSGAEDATAKTDLH